MGIIIGGVLPAILFGLIGILQKLSAQSGTNVCVWLAAFGAAMLLFGCVGIAAQRNTDWSPLGASYAASAGFAYAVGSGALTLALVYYNAPISKLTPILNTSTLITIIAGLILFNEAAKVDAKQLGLGTVLIIAGVTLVTRA